MQCFQKDPNLRVTAKKLSKHPWIIGCKRSDAPVSKTPSNFSQAVEEVKQWNKALKSSENNLRASTGSDSGGSYFPGPYGSRFNPSDPHRSNHATPAKGPLVLAKPRPSAEAFRSPELAGKLRTFIPSGKLKIGQTQLTRADDDNWDNDFATAISPSSLQLPHLKGQDNFGGLLSADRLKAFASIDGQRDDSDDWNDNFEGELMTIKGLQQWAEPEPQEQTIRPLPKKTEKTLEQKAQQGHRRQRSKANLVSQSSRSPVKSQFPTKFELPPRPDLIYREQSVEDYSDLLADNDSVFSNRPNLVLKVRQISVSNLFHSLC